MIPNLRIVMRDDWIEILIVSFYSGDCYLYKFYPNGTVVEQEREGGKAISEQKVDLYRAMEIIAEITAYNLWALEDGDLHL